MKEQASLWQTQRSLQLLQSNSVPSLNRSKDTAIAKLSVMVQSTNPSHSGLHDSKTLTRAIHAGLLVLDSVDYSIRNEKLVKTSDVLTVTLDISTFNQYAQLGVVLHLTHIEEEGMDALGPQLHKV